MKIIFYKKIISFFKKIKCIKIKYIFEGKSKNKILFSKIMRKKIFLKKRTIKWKSEEYIKVENESDVQKKVN